MDNRTLQQHRGDGLPFRISLEAVNKGVGLVALGLPFVLLAVTWLGNTCPDIDSISHYYYSRLGGDILVGSLCFIGLLLLFFYKAPIEKKKKNDPARLKVDGYLGHLKWDIWLARLAGLCAFGVALAPTAGSGCEDFAGNTVRLFLSGASGALAFDMDTIRVVLTEGDATEIAALAQGLEATTIGFDFWATLGVTGGILTAIHYGAALGMFLVLAYFSLVVFPRPQSAVSKEGLTEENTARKRLRNLAYRVFGVLILIGIGALAYKFVAIEDGSDALRRWNERDLTFWFEALALGAFGASWALKGRISRASATRPRTTPGLPLRV